MRGRLLAIPILLLPCAAFAQQYSIKNYSVEQGLSQSQVNALLQDRRGYLWIGTYGGGLDRFDGVRFTHYTTREGLPDDTVLSLYEDRRSILWVNTARGACKYDGHRFVPFTVAGAAGSAVRSMLEDGDGALWFGTDSGVTRYDGKVFTAYATTDGLARGPVRSMLRDRTGALWFGTQGGGVTRFDRHSFRTYTTADGLGANTVYAILEDRHGTIWFATEHGLSRYDGARIANLTVDDGLPSNVVRTLLQDRTGTLWIGTAGGGISEFDGRTFKTLDERRGLSSNTVWSLLEDREGNIWVGTYRGGLDKYAGRTFRRYGVADGLGDAVVRSITEDATGHLWFGTSRGGAAQFDGHLFRRYTARNGLVDDFVLAILPDRNGNVWFGTTRGLSKYDGRAFTSYTTRDGLSDSMIRCIIQDRQGDIWLGTNAGGIGRFDGSTFSWLSAMDGLNSNEVMSLLEDRRGHIWIGTTKGVSRFDGRRLTNVSAAIGVAQNQLVSAIAEDRDGNIWLGIYGGGVVKYSVPDGAPGARLEGHVERFDRANGLSNDHVVSIAFDDRGHLWVGTERGIDRLAVGKDRRADEPMFRHYGSEEGFTGIECIHNAIWRARSGHMWFGTLRGAFEYSPEDDHAMDVSPLVHITDVSLFFESIDWSKYTHGPDDGRGLFRGLELPHDRNHLSFGFVAVGFRAPEMLTCQYRLEGLDRDWAPATQATRATYSFIPAGTYTFRVRSYSREKMGARDEATFTFTIAPPWWRTWWFYAVLGTAAFGGAWLLVRVRTGHLEKVRTALEHEVAQRTMALQKARDELEDRVRARTEELATANEQLVQSQKMEAVGTLAGGIAHDFNNLLTVINGYADFGLAELDENDRLYGDLVEIRRAGDKAAGLTRQLLAFSRRQVMNMEAIDLNEVVRSVEKMLRRVIGEDVLLLTALDADLGRVRADASQIEQIIVNLAVNARGAMPKGGTLTISTGNLVVDEHLAAGQSFARPGPYVRLSLQDTGVGIPGENLNRIFEPFFTTKEKGKGTGLGLAVVYGIVKQCEGNIVVHSEPGKGTRFDVYLPRTDEAPAAAVRDGAGSTSSGNEQIVLVEDEDAVRLVGERILRKLGYDVRSARSAEEALAILAEHARSIRLVITDVIMPDMSGPELAETIAARYPAIRVLYVSGYSDDAIGRHGVLDGNAMLLQKPFTTEQMARKVRAALNGACGPSTGPEDA